MTTYGYARVSTNGQDLAPQEAELVAAGCAKVFKERCRVQRPTAPNWPSYSARSRAATCSSSPDWTGWHVRPAICSTSLRHSLSAAGFKSLKDTWADTTSPHGRLMLTVLGGLAEFERELIRARTGEGRKRAKDRGVKFGRPAALTPHQRQEALQRLANGNAQVDIARAFNVSQATISRLASL